MTAVDGELIRRAIAGDQDAANEAMGQALGILVENGVATAEEANFVGALLAVDDAMGDHLERARLERIARRKRIDDVREDMRAGRRPRLTLPDLDAGLKR